MKYGNIDGLIHGQWRVEHDSGQLGAAVDDFTISNLTNGKYKLITYYVNDSAGAVSYQIQFNGDTGASQYGFQQMYGIGGTTGAGAGNRSDILGAYCDATGELGFDMLEIESNEGQLTVVNSLMMGQASGTAVKRIHSRGMVWNSTAGTNSLYILGNTNAIGVGSHIILLKLVDASDGMKYGDMTVKGSLANCWERIASHTVSGSAETAHTFSGLAGNTDIVYMLKGYRLCSSPTASGLILHFNSDTAANYGYQFLYGSNTTAGCASVSTSTSFTNTASSVDSGQSDVFEALVYAKSGHGRPILSKIANEFSGTSVEFVDVRGGIWNNTADEMTSITVTATQTDGLGIGTVLDLYRLNL